MSIESDVIQFCADRLHVPKENIEKNCDLINDFDWSNSDYGEFSSEFVEDFISGFSIAMTRNSFRAYVDKFDIPMWRYPFSYVYFTFAGRIPIDINRLMVEDLIDYAKKRKWS